MTRAMKIALAFITVAIIGIALVLGGLFGNRLPLNAPPGLGTRLATYFGNNVAVTRVNHPFAELRTRKLPGAPQEVFQLVLTAIEALGWKVAWTDDKAFDLRMLRSMANRIGAAITEVPASHAVFMTQPKVVADVIDSAARQTGRAAR